MKQKSAMSVWDLNTERRYGSFAAAQNKACRIASIPKMNANIAMNAIWPSVTLSLRAIKQRTFGPLYNQMRLLSRVSALRCGVRVGGIEPPTVSLRGSCSAN